MPTSRVRRGAGRWAAAALALAASSAPGERSWVLVTRDLEEVSGTLASIEGGVVTLRGADGVEIVESMERVVALAPEGGVEPVRRGFAPEAAFIGLTDGQRVFALMRGSEGGEALSCVIAPFGASSLSLERVARVDRPAGARVEHAWAPGSGDVVVLANGDAVSGFVTGMGTEVRVETEEGRSVGVAFEQTSWVRLDNPGRAVAGTYVHLRDGSVLRGEGLRVGASLRVGFEGDALSLGLTSDSTGAAAFESAEDALAGVRVERARERVQSLAGMALASHHPTGERRWAPAPTPTPMGDGEGVLGAPSIDLHGPVAARWELPEGARRFAAVVTPDAGPWTDCVVRVWAHGAGGRTLELWSRRFDASSAPERVNLELPEGAAGLTVEVDAAGRGPIQDRVVLGRPVVLVEVR